MISREEKRAAVEMFRKGTPINRLARTYKVNPIDIRRWAHELAGKPKPEPKPPTHHCDACGIYVVIEAELCGFCEGERAENAARRTLAAA